MGLGTPLSAGALACDSPLLTSLRVFGVSQSNWIVAEKDCRPTYCKEAASLLTISSRPIQVFDAAKLLTIGAIPIPGHGMDLERRFIQFVGLVVQLDGFQGGVESAALERRRKALQWNRRSRSIVHPKTFRISFYLLALVAVAATLHGCGRSEAPAASSPADNVPPVFVPDTKPIPPVHWIEATVPRGTPIRLSLIDILTSETTRKGEAFRALVTEAIVIDGIVTVPSGSNVVGVVSEVVPGTTGSQGRGGMLVLQFNRIDTPTGARASLKARLAELKPVRSSAILVGGGAPGAVVAGAKGREVVIGSDTPLTLVLEEPLHIKVKQ
jgi:hypothetical protein